MAKDKPKPKGPETEPAAFLEVEKWARLSLADMKFYKGLQDALEDLDNLRARLIKAPPKE